MEHAQLFDVTGTGTGTRLRAACTLRGLRPLGGFLPADGFGAASSAPDPDGESPAAT